MPVSSQQTRRLRRRLQTLQPATHRATGRSGHQREVPVDSQCCLRHHRTDPNGAEEAYHREAQLRSLQMYQTANLTLVMVVSTAAETPSTTTALTSPQATACGCGRSQGLSEGQSTSSTKMLSSSIVRNGHPKVVKGTPGSPQQRHIEKHWPQVQCGD